MKIDLELLLDEHMRKIYSFTYLKYSQLTLKI
jgi:hypothetical protein